MKKIFTIGYEGASLSGLLGTLLHMRIEHVADIREIAQSRRPGFSKSALENALSEVGISYSHCKRLAHIGFHKWTGQVSQKDINITREASKLDARHGYDSQSFYHGLDDPMSLIKKYEEPLRRLAFR